MMAHDPGISSLTLSKPVNSNLQLFSELSTDYSHAKPIVEISIKDAAKLGTRFQRINT
jgi:hypothetical protein